MEGPQLDGARDVWMRRAGPFYGLVVAARDQTRLPVAPELDPTEADRERGVPWAPAVGAILGLALGFVAAILGQIGLAAGVVAALIACTWVIAGGGWSELGSARAGDRLLERYRDETERGSLTVTVVIILALSLVVRVAALLGIETGYWTEVLFVTPVVARFAPVAGALTRTLLSMRKTDETPSLPVALLISAGLVAAVAIIAGGGAGIGAFVITLGLGAGAALLGRTNSDAQLILAAELAALLCFAASDTYPLL